MITLGPLGILQPWILAGLLTLPVIWWLLRFIPPRPKKIFFPPTRLLRGLESQDQTPAHSPWWLTALRILLVSLIILALAHPMLNPEKQTIGGNGPIILVVDNGWTSASAWDARKAYIDGVISRAEQDGRTMILAATAPGTSYGPLVPQSPARVRERALNLTPQPFAPDRSAALELLRHNLTAIKNASIFWLSDGLDYGDAQEFAEGLQTLSGSKGRLKIIRDTQPPGAVGLHAILDGSSELKARIVRPSGSARRGLVQAWSGRSERLGEVPYAFKDAETQTTVKFDIPLELRNQVARIEIADSHSAGAVYLLDASSRRRRVGLISGESRELSQPLLSPLYYIERALSPYTETLSTNDRNIAKAAEQLLAQNPSILILADIGKLVGQTFGHINSWVEKGGVLIRFAGARLEKDSDSLLPVHLRQGGRTLGGALSWSTPQQLAPFDDDSLFHGLIPPEDVTVKRQVLADPGQRDSTSLVWARLKDGTPLVTAEKRAKGWIVLFHVTANSDWSNLPLSGLFVEMLRRLTDLSNLAAHHTAGDEQALVKANSLFSKVDVLMPLQTLDGAGQLVSPPPDVEPIAASNIMEIKTGPKHPPGYYGPAALARAINLIGPKTVLRRFEGAPAGALTDTYQTSQPFDLKPWLLLVVLGLFLIDTAAMIALGGGLFRRPLSSRPALNLCLALAVIATGCATAPLVARAQNNLSAEEQFALKASLKTRLAYVITGDNETDQISHQGLNGLSRVIAARTAIEPAEPMGVDINRDELAFFPIIYWPVRQDAQPLTEVTLARIDAFMKQGGLIVFDTRDYQASLTMGTQNGQGPGARALQRLLGRLDIPPLEPVPQSHVLTKSFYLLQGFPGRWDGGTLWVEAQSQDRDQPERRARHSDGVSSILVTSNDLAAAWALDDNNRPLYPTVPGGELQREMAFRTGINIVMYALTGNYKADQVHVPALLERLGQ